MKHLFTIVILVIALFSSCENESHRQAEETVLSFMNLIQKGDTDSVSIILPELLDLEGIYKSDSFKIKSINKYDTTIVIEGTNYYANNFNKKFVNSIKFYLQKDSSEKFEKMIDCSGLFDYSDNDFYKFGKTHNYITGGDTTDLMIKRAISRAANSIIGLSIGLQKALENEVVLSDLSWDVGYSNSAHGNVLVKNKTPFNLRGIDYHISYSTYGNSFVTSDGGIAFLSLPAYTTRSFSFYTDYVGNARRANVSLEFDSFELIAMIMDDYQYPDIELYLIDYFGDSLINIIMVGDLSAID